MKAKNLGMGLLMGLILSIASGQVLATQPPVAKLVQIEGDVEYSRNGNSWSPVRRTKYLFPGYMIRTGQDGSGKLINQESGKSQDVGTNTELMIAENTVQVVRGSLSEPEKEETSIFQSLLNKFAKTQRYTTVRRGSSKEESGCTNKLRTADVTVSSAHNELVWSNVCPEYSYRLIIGKDPANQQTFDVPARATAEMIRVSVTDKVEPGEYSYRVQVLEDSVIVFDDTRRFSTFTLLDDKAEAPILAAIADAGDDLLVQTAIYEENGLHVAAMDAYRDYFQEYPEDFELRGLLWSSYRTLKLRDLMNLEARLYQAANNPEEQEEMEES